MQTEQSDVSRQERDMGLISDDEAAAAAAVEALLEDLSRCQLRFSLSEEGDAFVELLGLLPPSLTCERGPVKVDNLGDKVAAWLHEPEVWKPEQRRALADLLEKLGYEGS